MMSKVETLDAAGAVLSKGQKKKLAKKLAQK